MWAGHSPESLFRADPADTTAPGPAAAVTVLTSAKRGGDRPWEYSPSR